LIFGIGVAASGFLALTVGVVKGIIEREERRRNRND